MTSQKKRRANCDGGSAFTGSAQQTEAWATSYANDLRALPHFETLPALAGQGQLVVLDLDGDELTTFARLRDASFASQFSVLAGLGRGEAAALAIALGRG